MRASRAAASRLLDRGGALVADYETFALIELAADALSDEPDADLRAHENVVHLNAGPLDTTQARARSLRRVRGAFGGKALHLVQFAGPVKPAWLDELSGTGARIVTYIPSNTFLVYGDAAQISGVQALAGQRRHIQWDASYEDEFKFDRRGPAFNGAKGGAAAQSDLYAVQLVDDPPANNDTLVVIDRVKAAPVRRSWRLLDYLNVIVRIPPQKLAELARQPDVVSIQPYVTPILYDERQDQIVAGNLSGSGPSGPGYLSWLASWNLTQAQFDASGFVVDVTDSGVDNATLAPNHFGLYVGGILPGTSRVAYNRLEGSPNPGSTLKGCDGHGTINAHIIGGYSNLTGFPFGDAEGYRYGLGVAPFVRVGSSVIFDPSNFTFPNYANLQSKAYQDTARISSNSWGADVFGAYDVDAQMYDALVRDAQPAGSTFAAPGNQEMVIVFANGNRGVQGPGTVGSPASAKNVISVGAAENVRAFGGADNCGISDTDANSANDIITFSSRGPTTDGRNKPDIVAPGTHVTGGVTQTASPGPTGTADPCFDGEGVCGGVAPGNFFPGAQQFYTASSGTSHSCPAAAGGAALVRQFVLNMGMPAPSPALTKALLMNSARYLTGLHANDTLWSNNQGMGGMNLGEAFGRWVTPTIMRDQVAADVFTVSGQQRLFTGAVADLSKPVRVTLAWTDAPGSTIGAAYRNDLDLVVTLEGIAYKGNVFAGPASVPGGSADLRNNVESVFLPAGKSGNMLVSVTAANINSDGVPQSGGGLDQDFALVVYNASEVALPVIAAVGTSLVSEGCLPANNAVDPSEMVTVNFSLQNVGSADAADVVATLIAGGGVTSPSGSQSYGTLVAGGAAVSMPFTFIASGACGATIVGTLQLEDADGPLGSAAFPMAMGSVTTQMAENFDAPIPPALPSGWTASATGNVTPWQTTSGAGDSPPNSVFASNPSTLTNNTLTSPSIPISTASARLTFRHSYGLENGYDGGVLEIAIGGGGFGDILTAGGLFVTGGYDKTISGCCSNPLAGRAAWTGSSPGFMTTTVSLPASAAGQSIRLRWRLGTDYSVPGTGWYVDSISVSEPACCVCVPPEAPSNLQATPSAVCPGAGSTLSAIPGIGGDTIDWFTVSGCGGSPLTSGQEAVVSPNATTNYYARTRHSTTGCSGGCAGPLTVTVNPPAACVRSILAWRSVRTHTVAGALGILLDAGAAGNGTSGPTVESRDGGIQRIEIDLDQPATLIGPGQVSVIGRITSGGAPGSPGAYAPSSISMADADTLAITFDPGALPDSACYTITLGPGTFAETIAGDMDVNVRSLHGDATMSGDVTLSDAVFIRTRIGSPVQNGPELDFDLSGDIGMDDVIGAKSRVSSPADQALCP